MIQKINHLNLEHKIGLKQMMNHEECIMLIVTLNLKLQLQCRNYAIIVMHTYSNAYV